MQSSETAQDESLVRQFFAEHWRTSLVAALFTYLTITVLWSGFRPGLRKIPGPLLARFTRLFLAYHASKGDGHTLYQHLHHEILFFGKLLTAIRTDSIVVVPTRAKKTSQYGTMVRVGPNKVSISDPEVIPVIYKIGSKYEKSAFYNAFATTYKRRPLENLFATLDTEWHRRMKSTVAQAYSLSSLRHFESRINECSVMFTNAMSDMAGQPIDLGRWVQWYAFDVIGKITFSQDFGFLRNRKDSLNVVDGIDTGTKFNTVIGQVPELHPWLLGNERLMDLLMSIPAAAEANPVSTLKKMISEAMASHNQSDPQEAGDFLDHLRKAQAKDPGRLTDAELNSALLNNLFAGSDTTAISLMAVFYFLVKNPNAYQKLTDEIDQADQNGELSKFVEFQQGLGLKYLQAVLKEALRLHPGVSMPLERVVPAEGAELCGVFLPGGTVVGMHAWVIHHDENIFGKDSHEFRPERWLEADAERLKVMERSFCAVSGSSRSCATLFDDHSRIKPTLADVTKQFGYGSRVCLGKNISMLEMTKFVPQILRQFRLEWASQKDEWEIGGYWFAKQRGVVMRLFPREKTT